MPSAKKRKTKGSKQTPKPKAAGGTLDHFLQNTPTASPDLKMAELRSFSHEASGPHTQPVSPAVSSASDAYSDTPPDLRADLQGSPLHPSSLQMILELRTLLQALPTRMDIEALITRLEEQHLRDIQRINRRSNPFPPA